MASHEPEETGTHDHHHHADGPGEHPDAAHDHHHADASSDDTDAAAHEPEDLLLALAEGLQEWVGDRTPTEADTREFLRERLRAQGKNDDEIAAILDDL